MQEFKKIWILTDDYPTYIFIDDKRYTHFLGCYLPCELYDLSKEQLKELNEIRLTENFVNWDYNKYIIEKLIALSGIDEGEKILDFGFGNGFAKDILKDYEYYGIDLDSWQTIHGLTFDVVISCFVFDFDIIKDIENIYNHLKSGGRLVFNVYKFWDGGKHFEEIKQELIRLNFEIEIQETEVPENFKIRHKKDTFVIAKK